MWKALELCDLVRDTEEHPTHPTRLSQPRGPIHLSIAFPHVSLTTTHFPLKNSLGLIFPSEKDGLFAWATGKVQVSKSRKQRITVAGLTFCFVYNFFDLLTLILDTEQLCSSLPCSVASFAKHGSLVLSLLLLADDSHWPSSWATPAGT